MNFRMHDFLFFMEAVSDTQKYLHNSFFEFDINLHFQKICTSCLHETWPDAKI